MQAFRACAYPLAKSALSLVKTPLAAPTFARRRAERRSSRVAPACAEGSADDLFGTLRASSRYARRYLSSAKARHHDPFQADPAPARTSNPSSTRCRFPGRMAPQEPEQYRLPCSRVGARSRGTRRGQSDELQRPRRDAEMSLQCLARVQSKARRQLASRHNIAADDSTVTRRRIEPRNC
jgi:hypothetical protein